MYKLYIDTKQKTPNHERQETECTKSNHNNKNRKHVICFCT